MFRKEDNLRSNVHRLQLSSKPLKNASSNGKLSTDNSFKSKQKTNYTDNFKQPNGFNQQVSQQYYTKTINRNSYLLAKEQYLNYNNNRNYNKNNNRQKIQNVKYGEVNSIYSDKNSYFYTGGNTCMPKEQNILQLNSYINRIEKYDQSITKIKKDTYWNLGAQKPLLSDSLSKIDKQIQKTRSLSKKLTKNNLKNGIAITMGKEVKKKCKFNLQ